MNSDSLISMSKDDFTKEHCKNYEYFLKRSLLVDLMKQSLRENELNAKSKEDLSFVTDTTNNFWKANMLATIDNEQRTQTGLEKRMASIAKLNIEHKVKLKRLLEVGVTKMYEEINEYHDLNDVQNRLENIEHKKSVHKDLEQSYKMKLKNLFQIGDELMLVLNRYLDDYKCNFSINMEKAECELLLNKFDSTWEKIRSIYLEFASDTYSSERLKALKSIKQLIELQKYKFTENYESLKNASELYKSNGKEYDELVKEYSKLLEERDNRKQVLDRIKSDFH